MKILHLTLKKKWFEMILSGEKKEEYRETKKYWYQRLISKRYGTFRHFDIVIFKNGYSKDARTMTVECKGIRTDFAKPEWSDNAQGFYYVISLGKILNQ